LSSHARLEAFVIQTKLTALDIAVHEIIAVHTCQDDATHTSSDRRPQLKFGVEADGTRIKFKRGCFSTASTALHGSECP